MRVLRWLAGVAIFLVVCWAGYLVLRAQGVLGPWRMGTVKEVPAGDQEIAFIAPATSDEAWERVVAAARHLVGQWGKIAPNSPALAATVDDAFLEQTTAIPEFGLQLEGVPGTLWVRWYKVSSEMDSRSWIEHLARRNPAPLAILGGDTSDRAVVMGRALHDHLGSWHGKPPLFLISTATADRFYPGNVQPGGVHDDNLTRDNWPTLLELYKGRSFRFSFTNARMAEAMMEFIQEHREVWQSVRQEPEYFAGLVADAIPSAMLGRLAGGGHFQSPMLYTLGWIDDRYSLDLADRLGQVFLDIFYEGRRGFAFSRLTNDYVQYGVGDYYIANPRESHAVGVFLAHTGQAPNQPQILALPTASQKARRFLRLLYNMAPREARNLVVVNGDSLTFNHVYRDRDLAWNVFDMPVPLVFFSHRNPVSATAGFGKKVAVGGQERTATTGTQDLLLYADMLSAVVQAAFHTTGLHDDADLVNRNLKASRWLRGQVVNPSFSKGTVADNELFDAEGNRRRYTGEHVVWLRPEIIGDVVQTRAVISVWRARADEPGRGSWRLAAPPLEVLYNNVAMPGNQIHDPD